MTSFVSFDSVERQSAMGSRHAFVSVEHPSFADVRRNVEHFIGGETPRVAVGLFFDVIDETENVANAVKFLKERGIEDTSPIWRELDPSTFVIDIIVDGPWRSALVVLAAETIAEYVTRELQTRATIHLGGDASVPYVIVDRGRIIRRFREHYDEYVRHLRWQPVES